jgi:hypothetical protein
MTLVILFVVSVIKYKSAADVTTAMGAVTGVVAALVGAYFGIRGATLNQTAADEGSTPKKQRSV